LQISRNVSPQYFVFSFCFFLIISLHILTNTTFTFLRHWWKLYRQNNVFPCFIVIRLHSKVTNFGFYLQNVFFSSLFSLYTLCLCGDDNRQQTTVMDSAFLKISTWWFLMLLHGRILNVSWVLYSVRIYLQYT
jgi:hypothetical protein